jgi:hypothetical protein
MIKRIAMVMVLAAAACGGGSKQESTTTTGTDVTASAGVQLALGEMKLVDVNKNQAVLIHADGSLEIPGMDGPTGVKVTSDGKIVNDKGEVGFQLQPDGTITGPDGQKLGVTLDAAGVVSSGDKKISLGDDGLLVGGNPDAPQMRVEGANDPQLRRTAMFVLIALTAPGKVSVDSAPAVEEVGPAAEPPTEATPE